MSLAPNDWNELIAWGKVDDLLRLSRIPVYIEWFDGEKRGVTVVRVQVKSSDYLIKTTTVTRTIPIMRTQTVMQTQAVTVT